MSAQAYSGELFAGTGMLGRAVGEVFGTRPRWFCEFDAAPSKVLAHHYPDVPNYGDVTKVDFRTVPHTHVRAGGFPCQDVSVSGARAGLRDGTRSGLWSEFARSIAEDRPDWVVIENVGGLLSAEARGGTGTDLEPCPWCVGNDDSEPRLRALGAVLADLAALGFDAEWTSIRASDVGAPHPRLRIFILAWPAERTVTADTVDERRPVAVRSGRETRPRSAQSNRSSAADSDSDGLGGVRGLHTVERHADRCGRPITAREGAQSAEPAADAHDATRNGKRTRPQSRHGGADAGLTLLPTPVAQPSGNSPREHLRKKPGREVVTDLAILAENGLLETGGRLLPTPRASDSDGGTWERSVTGNDLRTEVALLPTPTVGNATGGNARRGGDRGDEKLLPGIVVDLATGAMLPTPRASRGGSAPETLYGLGGERDDEERAQGRVALLPTPTARLGDEHGRGASNPARRKELNPKRGGELDEVAVHRVATNWGPYAAAIERWESVLGREAPDAVRISDESLARWTRKVERRRAGKDRRPVGMRGSLRKPNPSLNPELTEWMMGWPFGWVTASVIGLSRAEQLKACGNGVVLQQAIAALRLLLARRGVPQIEWEMAA